MKITVQVSRSRRSVILLQYTPCTTILHHYDITLLDVQLEVGLQPLSEARNGRQSNEVLQLFWKLVLQLSCYPSDEVVAKLNAGQT